MNNDDDTIIIIINSCCRFRRTVIYRLHYIRYYTRARIVFKKARAYRQRTIYYHTRTVVAEEATIEGGMRLGLLGPVQRQ